MAYGDPLVTTSGPSYGQNIVRNVGNGGGGGVPDPHAISHESGGSDEISVEGLLGLLADGQTPISHKTSHENGGSDELDLTGLSGGFQNPYPNPVTFEGDVKFGSGGLVPVSVLDGSDLLIYDEQGIIFTEGPYGDPFSAVEYNHLNISAGGLTSNARAADAGSVVRQDPGVSFIAQWWDGAASQPREIILNTYMDIITGIHFLDFSGGGARLSGRVELRASRVEESSLLMPPGVAPTVKINGDIWNLTAAQHHYLNGVDREVMYV